ncbi:MAG: sigma-E factor negative regulatory protein [Thiolinea sp.]
MKTNQNEYLSALLDDEAGNFEQRRLLDELCENTELGKTLSRYALVGEVMRSQQRTVVDSGGFLAGIQARLEDEPVYNEVVAEAAATSGTVVQGRLQSDFVMEKPLRQPWYRANTARYAMAASVAVAALAGILIAQNDSSRQDLTGTEALAKAGAPAVVNANTVPTPESISNEPAQIAAGTPVAPVINTNRRMALADAQLGRETADTLKQYVTLHMQYRSSNGIAPSIQAISYAK